MIVPLNPPLEGTAAERFLALAQTLARARQRNTDDLQAILEQELCWLHAQPYQDDQALSYEASARVLLDLIRLGWQVREAGYGIELIAEPPRLRGLSPSEIREEKAQTRRFFEPTVQAQLDDPAVRSFAQHMENPSAKTGKRPVTLLVAEGSELHARLLAARQSATLSDDPLASAVSPYLQLVTADGIDRFTGHSLREIWRYFRYSWSIPQFSTPGRQLLYLVRDAAHPCHAVMGIFGLNNCALQMGEEREYHLGWNLRALSERLLTAANQSTKRLAEEYAWMESQVAAAIDEVDPSQLAEPEELANPTRDIIARLRRRAQEFDRLRDETLRELEKIRSGTDGPVLVAEMECDYDHPPVSEDLLRLEEKPSANPAMQKARRHLVARKRAALLAELLHARYVLKEYRGALLDPSRTTETIKREEVEIALQTVLAALRSRYAGINMLEISTCGAVPPYNPILGGKAAALLLFSPEIPDDYRRLYSRPSIISSQIKNAPVVRDSTLVYLGTTSLYAHGSSQYERIRLPAGIISAEQEELRYQRVGLTAGYGTLQFLNDTRAAVEKYLNRRLEFRDINSIFGEGPSPKLRRLVAGLRELGFPPDSLMIHNRQRLIYAAELTAQARNVLNGRPAVLPDYLRRPDEFRDATARIAAYWRKRWLETRLNHIPSMTALLTASRWKLSDCIRSAPLALDISQSAEKLDVTGGSVMKDRHGEHPGFDFWKAIAASGPKVTSESLSEADFSRIHVSSPLEDFITRSVRKGTSIFLTGNAGDGKTHVLRRLAPELRECRAVVVEDATALMRTNQIGPVLDRWREAIIGNKPFCIAINEYPLHLLRSASRSILPDFSAELDRQCLNRLAYGSKSIDEDEREDLVVIDLSLRNPLHPEFAQRMLSRIVSDTELENVSAEIAPMLTRNLSRLRDSQVQNRLLCLFQRLSDMGQRTTIRELWILLARMVLGYRADSQSSLSDSMGHWYSEILFASDQRFVLSRNLKLADPAKFSHPIWDSLIEDGENSTMAGWRFGLPRTKLLVRPDRVVFQALKRAFYFEHEDGEACFELEDSDSADFHALLRRHSDDDPVTKRDIIEAINRAYSPVNFPGCADSVYLWAGHRFHEQPSRVFVANRHIPETEFRLLRPRIPERAKDAFPEYQPDHLTLQYSGDRSRAISLRIDFPLYVTLQRLRRGLPRKLLPERDIFRLDSFIEALDGVAGHPERRILSAHLGQRELLEIEVGTDRKRYERITKVR